MRNRLTAHDRDTYHAYQTKWLERLGENLKRELESLFPNNVVATRVKRMETVLNKLSRRPELMLSQMTDTVGARIVVSSLADQDATVAKLQARYTAQSVDDKRLNPKHGYRAVHLDINYQNQLVEIQVQTVNQRQWQNVSEVAAEHDIGIKYGGGNQTAQQALTKLSEATWQCDQEGVQLTTSQLEEAESAVRSAYALADTAPEQNP